MAHTYRVSEGKREGQRPLSKSRRKQTYTIKIQLTESGRESGLDPNGLGYRKSGRLSCTRQWEVRCYNMWENT